MPNAAKAKQYAWNLPPLAEWSIVGMNHYRAAGARNLFVAMSPTLSGKPRKRTRSPFFNRRRDRRADRRTLAPVRSTTLLRRNSFP
jgi:hypothetical protein